MTQKRKKYGHDFKEKIVLMSYESKNIAKLEKESGLQRGQLTVWRQKHETSGNGNFTAEHFFKLRCHYGKIQALEKKIRHMDEKFQILKCAGRYIDKEVPALLNFILKKEKTYSISLMCKVLNVDRGLYFKWKRNLPTQAQIRKKIKQQKIIDAFYAAEQRYGACRITAALQNEGIQICLATVKRYMKEMGLKCSTKKMAAAKRRNPSAAVRFSGS